MALGDRAKGIDYALPVGDKAASYTLTDLRNDDEVTRVSERFLTSLGEGENTDDLFQYFRGSNFNLADTYKVYRQSKDFTEEQAQDYLYLKNKFQNADVGGFGEKVQAGWDITQEIFTDPLTLTSAFFIPWTGGGSVAGRIAAGQAAKAALKQGVANKIRGKIGETVLKIPGSQIAKPLSKKAILGISSAEGFTFAGTHDYVYQSTQLQLGERTERDLAQTALSAATGAVVAPILVGGIGLVASTPRWLRSINENRIAKIDNNESYKNSYLETAVKKITDVGSKTKNVLGLFPLPARPTSFLRKVAKENPQLQKVLKLFKRDALEGFVAPSTGKQQILLPDYNAQLGAFMGNYQNKLKKILEDTKLYTFNKGEVPLPFTAGSWLNPLSSKKVKSRKSLKFRTKLSDEVNDDLVYFIRSGNLYKPADAGTGAASSGIKVKIDKNIIKAGKLIKKELSNILKQAENAGLKVGRVEDFFPRSWLPNVIKANKPEFISKIMKAEGASRKAAEELWENITTVGTVAGDSSLGLHSSLKSERLLLKLDDAEFGKFLDNDVEQVLNKYFGESGKLIIRTKLFGETEKDFITKWINPINKISPLSKLEEGYLKELYNITTGLKGRINRNRTDKLLGYDMPTGKIGAGMHDILTVTMQTSMLALSTFTSMGEIAIPLLLGADAKVGLKSIGKGMVDHGSEWWKKSKNEWLPYFDSYKGNPNKDIRSANRQDLNAFYISVNMAAEDRAVAMYGQAVGQAATKIQNMFFKGIGLHDWTRFVQLVGYDTGKNIIYKNLKTIASNPNLNKTAKARITDELAELGIDVQKGLGWIERGAKHTDSFYMKNVRKSAALYTNDVVMNPTAASAQKPLLHSLPQTKWTFGLMGFPTAFSNGPLRKAVRNLSRDGKTLSEDILSTDTWKRVSAGKAATASIFMTTVGMLNYTLRTRGKNWEDLESGKITEREMLERSLQYAGILGVGEYYIRYEKAERYEGKIMAALGAVTGPNLSDILDYTGAFVTEGELLEPIFKRAPFHSAFKSSFPKKYKIALDKVRELDDASPLATSKADKKSKVELFYKGGEVEVPYTKDEPEDRVDKFTGRPYSDQMNKLGLK